MLAYVIENFHQMQSLMCCQKIKGKCPLNVLGYLKYWNPTYCCNTQEVIGDELIYN